MNAKITSGNTKKTITLQRNRGDNDAVNLDNIRKYNEVKIEVETLLEEIKRLGKTPPYGYMDKLSLADSLLQDKETRVGAISTINNLKDEMSDHIGTPRD